MIAAIDARQVDREGMGLSHATTATRPGSARRSGPQHHRRGPWGWSLARTDPKGP